MIAAANGGDKDISQINEYKRNEHTTTFDIKGADRIQEKKVERQLHFYSAKLYLYSDLFLVKSVV